MRNWRWPMRWRTAAATACAQPRRRSGFRHPASACSERPIIGSSIRSIDQRHRFLFTRPRPFELRLDLPMPASKSEPRRPDGLMAVWGTLGVAQQLLAGSHGAARLSAGRPRPLRGCTLIAVADPDPATLLVENESIIHVPAWRWLGPEDAEAIVYSRQMLQRLDLFGLLDHLQRTGRTRPMGKREGDPPPAFSLFAADDVGAPGGLAPAWTLWSRPFVRCCPRETAIRRCRARLCRSRATPVLAVAPRVGFWKHIRCTGHGARLVYDPARTLACVRRCDDDQGNTWWMGDSACRSRSDHAQDCRCGDLDGEPAGLAVWQNGKRLHTHQSSGGDDVWHVVLPALPAHARCRRHRGRW